MDRLHPSNYQRQFQDSVVFMMTIPRIREEFYRSFNCFHQEGLVAGVEWKLVFWKSVLDDQDTLTLKFKTRHPVFNPYKMCGVLTLINDDREKCISHRFDGSYGINDNDVRVEHMITTDRLYSDGFLLPEGHLSILIECRVDSFRKVDGIRRLNLHDPKQTAVKISCASWQNPFYVERNVLKLHLGTYDCYLGNGESEIVLEEDTDVYDYGDFLQLIHGTYFADLKHSIPHDAIWYAFNEECSNILRLCERQLIYKDEVDYYFAIDYGFSLYFKHMLKKLKTLEEVQSAIGRYSFEKVDKEIMMVLVEKYFSLCDLNE